MRTMLASVLTAALGAGIAAWPQAAPQHVPAGPPPTLATADACIACHTGITSPAGDDVSFVSAWRPSMMSNSARDPYWHAGVRREVVDHPTAQAAIEGECSACHMPMAAYLARHGGGHGEVFTNLPAGMAMAPHADLAADGVSCTVCHQITPEALGTRASYNAHFRLGVAAPGAAPAIGGPFDVDAGRKRLMRSSSGYEPVRADHLSESDVCGSCHTLYTSSLGPKGEVVGELPEQMPYIEWKHSAFRTTRSCQSCHMPLVTGQVPVTPVLGDPRPNVSQHTFVGGNFFMQRMLNRHRAELGVAALPEELDASARRTLEYLASEAASLTLASARLSGGRLAVDVDVRNFGGHKLPTAYPSRRVWLHLVVRDAARAIVFESGAVRPDGAIAGNDNDEDPLRYEPHHREITDPRQVQIYEAIMGDPKNVVTTGLLTAVTYLKDNRLLPQGFDKATASPDVAVRGHASGDGDFMAGGDRVRYIVDLSKATGPFTVDAELRYQTIAFRWAQNLAGYAAPESSRFLGYYRAMAAGSSAVLATAGLRTE